MNTASDVEIVPPADIAYKGLAFSRDGDFIYYTVSEKSHPAPVLYQVPVLGGTGRKLIEGVDSAVTISPDGGQLAFVRDYIGQGEQSVIIASADGSAQRRLATRKLPNFFGSVSWSPDGRSIACGAGSYVPVYTEYLVGVSVADGKEKQIGSQTWRSIEQVAWVADGSAVVLVAAETATATPVQQIWNISYPSGEVHRITNDLNDYRGVSLTADSSKLVTSQSELTSSIWLMRDGDANHATQVSGSKRDGYWGLALSSDGKLIYTSQVSGREDIWMMNPDGSGKKQLTADPSIHTHPSMTGDGRYILYVSNQSGTSNIWRMNPDGGEPKQLTSGTGEDLPRSSPDGKWVVYVLLGSGKPTLWKVSIDGGSPQQLTESYTVFPDVSPDGRWIACVYRDEQPGSPFKIAILPFEGKDPIRLLPGINPDLNLIRWRPDGRAVMFAATKEGISSIWSQPIDGGQATEVTNSKLDEALWSFDLSHDGHSLVSARGSENSDIILISNFQ